MQQNRAQQNGAQQNGAQQNGAQQNRAQQDRLRRAARRARLSSLGVRAVSALAVVLGIGFVIYLVVPQGPRLPLPEAAKPETPGQLAARQSEISGADKDQLPYTIRAAKSVEDAANRKLVHMDAFNSVFERAGGKTYTVTSKQAQFDRDSKQLELSGEVNISDAPRMVAKMEKAHVDTEKRSLVSGSPVHVTLETGVVTADQLIADNNGERLLFKGKVKARFNAAQ